MRRERKMRKFEIRAAARTTEKKRQLILEKKKINKLINF